MDGKPNHFFIIILNWLQCDIDHHITDDNNNDYYTCVRYGGCHKTGNNLLCLLVNRKHLKNYFSLYNAVYILIGFMLSNSQALVMCNMHFKYVW